MKRLIVMRHAKSAWNTDAPTDHARPLNKRGRRDSPLIAAALLSRGWVPDKVLSSSSARTRETWARMADQFDPDLPTLFTDALYHGGVGAFRQAVASEDDGLGTLIVLGHNPGWESVVGWLSGQDVMMTTANAALLSANADTWRDAIEAEWTLHEVIRPKEL